ncbi:MAG: hypothetical protein FJZ93_09245 [Chloroflexi bacterium]|nr:hypothetical protein [Chloroflexota bacterium]
MAMRVERLTISLPSELVDLADKIAHEKKVSRSKVVSLCLQEYADRRLQKAMEEGYKAMAEENLTFAESAAHSVHEVLPEWK